MADIKLDDLAGDLTLLQSAADGLSLTIGEEFMPQARGLVQMGTGIISFVNEILDYTDFLGFLIDKFLAEHCSGDVGKLTNHLFLTDIFNPGGSGYVNFGLTKADSFQGCTVSDMFTVRLGDLAIPPCHRTAYDGLLYGRFRVEDGKITGIEEHNPQTASRILFQDSILCSPGCDCCPYNSFCLRGCYGAQQEAGKDPFMPIESVCRLFKGKIDFLIEKFEKLGVWDILEKISPVNARYEAVQETLQAVKRIREARL